MVRRYVRSLGRGYRLGEIVRMAGGRAGDGAARGGGRESDWRWGWGRCWIGAGHSVRVRGCRWEEGSVSVVLWGPTYMTATVPPAAEGQE